MTLTSSLSTILKLPIIDNAKADANDTLSHKKLTSANSIDLGVGVADASRPLEATKSNENQQNDDPGPAQSQVPMSTSAPCLLAVDEAPATQSPCDSSETTVQSGVSAGNGASGVTLIQNISTMSLDSANNSNLAREVVNTFLSVATLPTTLHEANSGSSSNCDSPQSQVSPNVALGRLPIPLSTASVRRSKIRYDTNFASSPNNILSMLPRSSTSTSSVSSVGNGPIADHQMSKFLSGFKRFQKTYFSDHKELYQSLKDGQHPKTLLIACCDSRVDPAIITDCEPGDLFVVRNVANLVAPYGPDDGHHGVSAALEFAVKGLEVENIIIMGHSRCGGIKALMKGIAETNETEFVGPWMRIASRARDKVVKHFGHKDMQEQQRACEHASILCSLENLTSYPWIKERLLASTLRITGWFFDFDSGMLLAWDPEKNVFEPLVDSPDEDGLVQEED